MEFRSIGDLASSIQLSKGATTNKAEINRLVEELTSGIVSDAGRAVSGDFGMLSSLSADEARLSAYHVSTTAAALFSSTAQHSLEAVQTSLVEMGAGLMSAAGSEKSLQVQAAVLGSNDKFSAAVSALNVDVAGRKVFSGTSTDTAPLVSAPEILNQLAPLVSGLTTASDVSATVASWFSTSSYLGGTDTLAPMQLNDDTDVSFGVTGNDDAIQGALVHLATAALLESESLHLADDELSALAMSTGSGLTDADASLTLLRAGVGSVQATIDEAQVQNEYEASSVEIWKNEILGVDEYRAATELQAAETQLQLLYTLTSRLSQMSLAGYL